VQLQQHRIPIARTVEQAQTSECLLPLLTTAGLEQCTAGEETAGHDVPAAGRVGVGQDEHGLPGTTVDQWAEDLEQSHRVQSTGGSTAGSTDRVAEGAA